MLYRLQAGCLMLAPSYAPSFIFAHTPLGCQCGLRISQFDNILARRTESAVLDEVLRTVRRIAGVEELGPHAPLLQAGLDSLGAYYVCEWMRQPSNMLSEQHGRHAARPRLHLNS